MDPILFVIPALLIIVGIAYMVYMNKQNKSVKAEINIDQERANYDEYKKELLENDFSQVKRWMKGKAIDAFTSGSIPKATSEKVKDLVGDGLKNVALSTIGIKLIRVDTDLFWVLSGTDLHFFTTDVEGELEEHLVFNNSRVENASLEYTGVLKAELGFYSKQSEEYLPKVHVITFDIDGSSLSLEIHDRLKYQPNPTDMLNVKKQLLTRAKYQVVGEKFTSILKGKYPNL